MPSLITAIHGQAFAAQWFVVPFIAFALLFDTSRGVSLAFRCLTSLFPCTSALCSSELSYAVAHLRSAELSFATPLLFDAWLRHCSAHACCAPLCRSFAQQGLAARRLSRTSLDSQRHSYLFNFFPSEATFTGVSPLTDTTKGAVVEPFSYGRLKVFVEKDDFKCD